MSDLHEGAVPEQAVIVQEAALPDLAMAVAESLGIQGEVHTDLLAQPEQTAGYLAMDLERNGFLGEGETSVTVSQVKVVLRALEIHACGIRDNSQANKTIFGAYVGTILDLMQTGRPRPEPEER